MKVERIVIQACCNKKQIVLRIDKPLDQSITDVLKSNGFTINPAFTQAGMLYADNLDLIVTGPFGGNKINVRCLKKDCETILDIFEDLLVRMG